jgi:hypothetical protein
MFVVAMCCAGFASAQTDTNSTPAASTPADVKAEEPSWSWSASAYGYIVPDSREFVVPVVTADRGVLHLEARYNYEGLDSGSVWAGYNISGSGHEIEWEITPMFGVVFGDTRGVAPGYKGSVSWWKLELYSEGEYVFNTDNSSDSFFYNWSELSISPLEWCRLGLVTQRTRLYQTDRDVQRGFLFGASLKRIDLTVYVFNPDDKPTWVFAGGFNF